MRCQQNIYFDSADGGVLMFIGGIFTRLPATTKAKIRLNTMMLTSSQGEPAPS